MYIFLLTCKNVISGGNHPPLDSFPFNFGLVVLGLSNKNIYSLKTWWESIPFFVHICALMMDMTLFKTIYGNDYGNDLR